MHALELHYAKKVFLESKMGEKESKIGEWEKQVGGLILLSIQKNQNRQKRSKFCQGLVTVMTNQ